MARYVGQDRRLAAEVARAKAELAEVLEPLEVPKSTPPR